MFGRKAIEALERMQDYDRRKAEERYWELRHKHDLLLRSLGLEMVTTAANTVYRKKGSPEQGA